jgi:hypothetical protein
MRQHIVQCVGHVLYAEVDRLVEGISAFVGDKFSINDSKVHGATIKT